jgi:hypothetical protein
VRPYSPDRLDDGDVKRSTIMINGEARMDVASASKYALVQSKPKSRTRLMEQLYINQ